MNTIIKLEHSLPEQLELFVKMESNSDTKKFIIPYSLSKHQIEFHSSNIIYLSIIYEDNLCGFFIINNDPETKSVEFRRIVVSKKGIGIGQAAIQKMHIYCKEILNAESIWLDVFEHNVRGKYIYEKLGYQKFKSEPYKSNILNYYRKKI